MYHVYEEYLTMRPNSFRSTTSCFRDNGCRKSKMRRMTSGWPKILNCQKYSVYTMNTYHASPIFCPFPSTIDPIEDNCSFLFRYMVQWCMRNFRKIIIIGQYFCEKIREMIGKIQKRFDQFDILCHTAPYKLKRKKVTMGNRTFRKNKQTKDYVCQVHWQRNSGEISHKTEKRFEEYVFCCHRVRQGKEKIRKKVHVFPKSSKRQRVWDKTSTKIWEKGGRLTTDDGQILIPWALVTQSNY